MPSYTTYLPQKFKLEGENEYIQLPAQRLEKAQDEPLFILWISPEKINGVDKYLQEIGFKKNGKPVEEGEKFDLGRPLAPQYDEWELHIRVFENGDIKPYIEVNREYLENVKNPKIYVVYEAFELYRAVYPDFNVKYNGKWIEEIKGNYSITLPAPSRLNPWKPIIGGLALAAIIGLAIWALSKPRDKK